MDKNISAVRVCLVAGLVIAALLIGFEAFYHPKAEEIVFVEESAAASSASSAVRQSEPKSSTQSQPISEKININTASVEELMKLSAIGEKTAEKIVHYREQNGHFESVEDLMKIDGIGQKTFEKIKNQITK